MTPVTCQKAKLFAALSTIFVGLWFGSVGASRLGQYTALMALGLFVFGLFQTIVGTCELTRRMRRADQEEIALAELTGDLTAVLQSQHDIT